MAQARAVALSTAGAVGIGVVLIGILWRRLLRRKGHDGTRGHKCTKAVSRQGPKGARSSAPATQVASSTTAAAKQSSTKLEQLSHAPPPGSATAAPGPQSHTAAKGSAKDSVRRKVLKRKSPKAASVIPGSTATCGSVQADAEPAIAGNQHGAAASISPHDAARNNQSNATPPVIGHTAVLPTAKPPEAVAAPAQASTAAGCNSRHHGRREQPGSTVHQADDCATGRGPKAGAVAAIAAEVQQALGQPAAEELAGNAATETVSQAEAHKAADESDNTGSHSEGQMLPHTPHTDVTLQQVPGPSHVLRPPQASTVDTGAVDAAQSAAKDQSPDAPTAILLAFRADEGAESAIRDMPSTATAPAQSCTSDLMQGTAAHMGVDDSEVAEKLESGPTADISRLNVDIVAQEEPAAATADRATVDADSTAPATAPSTAASATTPKLTLDTALPPSALEANLVQTATTSMNASAEPAASSSRLEVAGNPSGAQTEATAAAGAIFDSKTPLVLPDAVGSAVTPAQSTAIGLPPRRVSMAPTVDTAQVARQSSTRSRDNSTSGSSRKMTVADIIRESIKLKKSNERLKQQLNVKAQSEGSSGSSKSSSNGASRSAGKLNKSKQPQQRESQGAAAAGRTASLDVASQNELDQAAAVVMDNAQQRNPAADTAASALISSTGAGQLLQGGSLQHDTAADHGEMSDKVLTTAPGTGVSSSSSSSSRDSGSAGGSSRQQSSLSPADLLRELRSMKSENLELVKMLTAQLQEVRAQNAELMAAFHRGGSSSLEAVREETDGSGTKNNDGTSTPNTGSELGTFKDRLGVSGLGRTGSVTAESDAGSSLRSAPAGMSQNTTRKASSMWRWAAGGRRLGGAMTADNLSVGDNASIPDTLGSPRSNISIPVETLVDLLDGWGAR